MSKKTTDQVLPPQQRNPTGKGGFGDNPENRNPGGWKKDATPRFKLERMMALDEEALIAVAKDKDAPFFERKLAIAMNKGQWREIKEMIQEVYGKPKESVDVTSGGEPLQALVKFVGDDAAS